MSGQLALATLLSLAFAGEWIYSAMLRADGFAPDAPADAAFAGPRAWSLSRAALRTGTWLQERLGRELGEHASASELERECAEERVLDGVECGEHVRFETRARSPQP